MKVREFRVDRTKRGVIVTIRVELETEVKIDIPMHLDYAIGFTSLDIEKLQGKLSFEAVIIKTPLLTEKQQAEKAAKEIKALLQDLEYRETVELNRLLEVERYLKEQFRDYIEKDGGKSNE